ncbi:hypothetical protein Q5P01_011848 [Channa striata]|uniref:Uncharacterized protein n=1 Tax=Channa striata TaxID=64152 RepID=A0AA88SW29_CHASR|nr:hypothetical protein Q5P01_011848 [Channa striata]
MGNAAQWRLSAACFLSCSWSDDHRFGFNVDNRKLNVSSVSSRSVAAGEAGSSQEIHLSEIQREASCVRDQNNGDVQEAPDPPEGRGVSGREQKTTGGEAGDGPGRLQRGAPTDPRTG